MDKYQLVCHWCKFILYYYALWRERSNDERKKVRLTTGLCFYCDWNLNIESFNWKKNNNQQQQ